MPGPVFRFVHAESRLPALLAQSKAAGYLTRGANGKCRIYPDLREMAVPNHVRSAGGSNGRMAPSLIKRLAGSLFIRAHRAISWVGERVGSEALIYNPLARYGFERAARRNAPVFARALADSFPEALRLLDVGCGTGAFVETLSTTGREVIGVEYSAKLRQQCEARGVKVFPFDLSQKTAPPPGAPFDLVYSLEVAEHVPREFAGAMVDYMSGLSDLVVFTAAQPGQGGTHHINEQPRSYWISLFQQRGMSLDPEATTKMSAFLRDGGAFHYLPANISIFRRTAGEVS